MYFFRLNRKHAVSYLLILIGVCLWGYVLAFGAVDAQEDTTHALHFVLDNHSPRIISGEQIAVDPDHQYLWRTHIVVSKGSGEFGFYIDEYDANGEWISGQWKGAITSSGTQSVSFPYTPSTQNVYFAAPQYYKTIGTTFQVRVDSNSIQ